MLYILYPFQTIILLPCASSHNALLIISATSLVGVDSPSEMEVKEVNDNSVTVRWTPAQGPIKGYRVTGVPRNGQGPSFTEVVAPGMLFVEFCHYFRG